MSINDQTRLNVRNMLSNSNTCTWARHVKPYTSSDPHGVTLKMGYSQNTEVTAVPNDPLQADCCFTVLTLNSKVV